LTQLQNEMPSPDAAIPDDSIRNEYGFSSNSNQEPIAKQGVLQLAGLIKIHDPHTLRETRMASPPEKDRPVFP